MSKTTTKSTKVIAIAEELRKKELAYKGYATAAELCNDPATVIEGRSKLHQALETFKTENRIELEWNTQITPTNAFLLAINGIKYVSTGHKILATWTTQYHYDGETSNAHWDILDVSPCYITFFDGSRVSKARYNLGGYFRFSGHLGSIQLPETYEELAKMLHCETQHEALQVLQKVI